MNNNARTLIAVLIEAKALDALDFYYIYDKYKDEYFAMQLEQIEFGKIINTEFGMVFDLLSAMMAKGATKKELKDVVLYSYIVLDTKKHFLNYKKAYYDLGIDKKIIRYLKDNTKVTTITQEQIDDVAKQDPATVRAYLERNK